MLNMYALKWYNLKYWTFLFIFGGLKKVKVPKWPSPDLNPFEPLWGALKHALHAKQPEFRGPGGFSMWQEKALSTTITKGPHASSKGGNTQELKSICKLLNRDHLVLFMAMLCFTSVQFWDVLYFNVNPIKNKRRASGPITLVFYGW